MVFIGFQEAFASLANAPQDGSDAPALALAFHRAVVDAGCVMVEHGRAVTGCQRVVLSGGVLMNRLIAEGLVAGLQERGFDVFLPCLIPMNDGGISFGQIYAVGGRPCASQSR